MTQGLSAGPFRRGVPPGVIADPHGYRGFQRLGPDTQQSAKSRFGKNYCITYYVKADKSASPSLTMRL